MIGFYNYSVIVTYLDNDNNKVPVVVTAQEGIINRVEVNPWGEEEDEHGINYELFTNGGLITITLPDEPPHTRACWNDVQDGEPGEPVAFDFMDRDATLYTDKGMQYDVEISFVHETEILPASDSAEDVSATNAVNELLAEIEQGNLPAGISDVLFEKMVAAFENHDDIIIEFSKEPVAESQVANDANTIKNKMDSLVEELDNM